MRRIVSVTALVLFPSIVILLSSCGVGGESSSSAKGNGGNEFRELTVNQAADTIQGQQGKVRVVLLYGAFCPASRKMFPQFVAHAETWREKNVQVLAFSTDKHEGLWRRYLGSSSVPFERMRILPWPEGQLDAAFRPTGIDIGAEFGTPLIAVIDRDGRVIGQQEGIDGVDRAEEWLRSLGI